jgi:3',5'-cyclic AMP phosphodiesterase CpdA
MKFDLKTAVEARDFLKSEGLLTKEYQSRTNKNKLVSDANQRYLDRTFNPKPTPLKTYPSQQKKGSQKRSTNSKYRSVSLNNHVHETIRKYVPKGKVGTVINRLSEIVIVFMMEYGNSYKTFINNNWKLVKVDDDYYDKMLNKTSKPKEIENNPFI